ncbi:hypothetical protein EOPP23_17260 [Endozoicomonas sp. OPT23]|uniref:hypothetical protein n=1 Tax=Endozoicomonas sp. OPT23 TaxID=2072845 RepID=UPI00129C02A6|nr:hypothetical protein [Endozoicomonas sp. OPT23]MRI34734.1 hypothetical protein [Endozoicomonas sp. OPT23]
MKRLYYLAKTLESVSKIVDDLHHEGISDWNIHVLSKDEAGLYHRHIHSAHIFQQNDVIHSGLLGAMMGIVFGTTFSLLIEYWLHAHDLSIAIHALVAGTFTMFGAWSGGLVGVMKENYKITRFHHDLEKGQYLLLIDIHKTEETAIRQQILRFHPETIFAAQGTSLIQPFNYHFWFPAKKV